jgi:uncharacterized protein (UPF0335 family)
MEVRTSNEARTNIEDFSKRYLNLLLQKKTIDFDIKELKQEFNEEGVPTGKVASIINRIKADKKKSDSELFELEAMREWIESNSEIDDQIGQLGAKS